MLNRGSAAFPVALQYVPLAAGLATWLLLAAWFRSESFHTSYWGEQRLWLFLCARTQLDFPRNKSGLVTDWTVWWKQDNREPIFSQMVSLFYSHFHQYSPQNEKVKPNVSPGRSNGWCFKSTSGNDIYLDYTTTVSVSELHEHDTLYVMVITQCPELSDKRSASGGESLQGLLLFNENVTSCDICCRLQSICSNTSDLMSRRANGKPTEMDLTDEEFRNRLNDWLILRFIELHERLMEVHSQLISEKDQ